MRGNSKRDTQKIRPGIDIGRLELRNVDVFWGINFLLFLWMLQYTYYQRFIEYRGTGNLDEFFVYSLLIIIGLAVGWWYFRRFTIPNYILFLVQFGIVIHFLGGMVLFDGKRLYDTSYLGIRFDKYVHFLNAFIAALVTNFFFNILQFRIPYLRNLIIILLVLGLGAIIEIVEYIVLLTIPTNGVGGYHNNMQDLLANFAGCIVYITTYKITTSVFGRDTYLPPAASKSARH